MKPTIKRLPTISIITPSFNQGHFIKETIDSVLSQNYPNLEYLVMDGGSTDDTVKILKSYGEKIKWISKKDKGQTDAINQGIKMTHGDIVAYLNSDDVMLPNTLNTIAEYFLNNNDAMWLTGDYFIIDEHGNKIQPLVIKYKRLLRNFPNKITLSIANFIIQPSTFWRRSLSNEIGFFREDLHYVMDFEYWMRIIQIYPLHVLSNPFSLFRIHGSSKGGSLFEKQFTQEHEIVVEYTKNPIIRLFNKIHSSLIVLIYKIIKN
jgi:glycosyltransferase involved in cell wall biosynthesis